MSFDFLDHDLERMANVFFNENEQLRILEIGSRDGNVSNYLIKTLLKHPNSSLICVDTFENDFQSFLLNIKGSLHPNKVRFYKLSSTDYFKTNKELFNFIYLDGVQEHFSIIDDLENVFKTVKIGGIVWIEYYLGGNTGLIKNLVDEFVQHHREQIEILYQEYQLAYRKIC